MVAETMGGARAADSGHGQEARLDMQPRERLGEAGGLRKSLELVCDFTILTTSGLVWRIDKV